MTPLFAHRAAEEFDRALEGRASRSGAERHADLLGTVETLRRMPPVEARPDFVADLRTRLMTAAETDLVAAPPVVRRAAADAHPRDPHPTPSGHRRRQPGDRGRHRRHGRGRLGRPARRVALPRQAGRRGHIHGRARRRREQGPLAARPGRHRLDEAQQLQAVGATARSSPRPSATSAPPPARAPTGCSGRTPAAPTPATSPRSATSPLGHEVPAEMGTTPPSPTTCSSRPTPWPGSTSRPRACAGPAGRTTPSGCPDAWPPAPAPPTSTVCCPARSPRPPPTSPR